MAKPTRCHLCGMTGGHTKQCSHNIKVDAKEHKEREERKKQLDAAKANMPRTEVPKK